MLPGMKSHADEIAQLERLGETEVRYQLAQFRYVGSSHVAEEWLRQREESRRSFNEAETLRTAKAASEAVCAQAIFAQRAADAAERAASAAFEQARWAKWAAMIATTAAVIATKDQISMFIALLL